MSKFVTEVGEFSPCSSGLIFESLLAGFVLSIKEAQQGVFLSLNIN